MELKHKKRIANMLYTVSGKYGIKVDGGDNSCTDLEEVTIHDDVVLSNLGLTEDEALNMQLSASAHEAGHLNDSDMPSMVKYMESMQKKGADLEKANLLLQVVEDYRIDTNIEKNRPGYRDMNRGTLQVMSKKFAEKPSDDERAYHLALSSLPYGVDYQKDYGWDNPIDWDGIRDVVDTLKENIDSLKSTNDVAKFATELYSKHFKYKSASGDEDKNDGDGDNEEQEENENNESGNKDGNKDGNKSDNKEGVFDAKGDGVKQENDENEKESNDANDDNYDDDSDDDSDSDEDDTLSREDLEKLIQKSCAQDLASDISKDSRAVKDALIEAQKRSNGKSATRTSERLDRSMLVSKYGKAILKESEIKTLENTVGTELNKGGKIHYCNNISIDTNERDVKDYWGIDAYNAIRSRRRALPLLKAKALRLSESIKASLSLLDVVVDTDTVNGKLTPNRVWKATHCNNNHVFRQSEQAEIGGFIVDLVVDASGSNSGRQEDIACALFVIASAFDTVGIPCRVVSFRTDRGFSVIERYRDYNDPKELTEKCLAYSADGANRDGHAYRTVYETSNKDPNLNHIMICVSDGQPADNSGYVAKEGGLEYYSNMHDENGKLLMSKRGEKDGTDDTAQAIREIRSKGVALMGVYIDENTRSIDKRAIACEKLCFGNSFVHITEMKNLEAIVSRVIRTEIEKTFQ